MQRTPKPTSQAKTPAALDETSRRSEAPDILRRVQLEFTFEERTSGTLTIDESVMRRPRYCVLVGIHSTLCGLTRLDQPTRRRSLPFVGEFFSDLTLNLSSHLFAVSSCVRGAVESLPVFCAANDQVELTHHRTDCRGTDAANPGLPCTPLCSVRVRRHLRRFHEFQSATSSSV